MISISIYLNRFILIYSHTYIYIYIDVYIYIYIYMVLCDAQHLHFSCFWYLQICHTYIYVYTYIYIYIHTSSLCLVNGSRASTWAEFFVAMCGKTEFAKCPRSYGFLQQIFHVQVLPRSVAGFMVSQTVAAPHSCTVRQSCSGFKGFQVRVCEGAFVLQSFQVECIAKGLIDEHDGIGHLRPFCFVLGQENRVLLS